MATQKTQTKKTDFLTAVKSRNRVETVTVEPFGKVYVRPVKWGVSRDLRAQAVRPGKSVDDPDGLDNEKLMLLVVAASLTDAKGARLIQPGDEAEFLELDNDVIQPLLNAGIRVNGSAPVEDAAGND